MRTSAPAYVLDTYALLAYLQDENGQASVQGLLEQAVLGRAILLMSVINLGEALYIIERERGLVSAQRVIALVDQLPITIVTADRPVTFAAAHIKAQHALSYADAFAVAVAQRNNAVVVTGDPEFRVVADLVSVMWL